MKKVVSLIIGILLIGGILWYLIPTNIMKDKDVKELSAYDEIFQEQEKVDKKIKKWSNDASFTLDQPKVILNPYKISPLTAIIIFKTKNEDSVDVSINDKVSFTTEKSKKHIIPIYGLFANYDNSVQLKINNDKKNLTIKTAAYKGDPITVEKTSKEIKDNLYFLSPNFVDDCIVNGEGKVVWYLDGDYAGDIEFLDNGHFYISDPNQGFNGVKINYSSFLEMDYMGKIYKQWITEYGLHHELVPLDNNKMLVLGAKDNSPFYDSIIYLMDLKTGKVLDYIDMYQFLHDIDPELIDSLGDNFDLVNNSADYNEKTGELLISLRGLNSLMKLNFKTKEIEWIFGDKEFWGDKFSKYLLKVKDDTRYLGGQHSAFYTKDGLIAVHNNDIDQFDLSNNNLSYYKDRYTSCDLLKVDEKNKTIETVWQYTANKEQFSNVAGHMELLDNDNKLITYGWSMKEEAYKKANQVIYTDPAYKNGVVIQLDENDEEIFKITMPGLIYRTFKINSFYNDKISNYEILEFERINGTKIGGKTLKTRKISNKLKKAKKFAGKVNIKTNRAYIDYEFKKKDAVELVLANNNKSIIYTYKKENKEAPSSFNSGMASKMINMPTGRYRVFIRINDIYYDTEKIVEF